jgi:hypothetical protein
MDPDIPSGLLNKVMFEILFYFCRRGRENLRELKVSDFEISRDETGRQYVWKKTSEQTKNHTGITNENEGEGARMYETGTKMCPVRSFEKYLGKRNPACDAFYQHPRGSFLDSDDSWYERKPLGKNTIGDLMATLSKEAGLSATYTNHCVRATTITVLNDAGFKDRAIVSVSGHRNEKSISSYVADTRVDTKRRMSDALSTVTKNLNAVVPASTHSSNAIPPSSCSRAHVTHSFNAIPASSCSRGPVAHSFNAIPASSCFNAIVPVSKPTSTRSLASMSPRAGHGPVVQNESFVDFMDCDESELMAALNEIDSASKTNDSLSLHTQNQQILNTTCMSAPSFNITNCVVNIYNKS